MPKIYSDVSQVKKINQEVLSYLRGHKKLPENAKIRYAWARNGQTNIPSERYAGQIEYTKVLPNGNNQTRLVTAYGDGSLEMTTAVKKPDGELLKAYAGIRDRSWKAVNPETNQVVKENLGTLKYSSGSKEEVMGEVRKNIQYNSPADMNNQYLLMRNK